MSFVIDKLELLKHTPGFLFFGVRFLEITGTFEYLLIILRHRQIGAVVFGELQNVVLEEKGEDKMARETN